MSPLIIIIICLIVVGLLTFFATSVYNSLVILKNKLDSDWQQLLGEINNRFEISLKYLELNKNYIPLDIIDNIKTINFDTKQISREEVMDNYIALEQNMSKVFIILEDQNLNLGEWNQTFIDNKTRLDQARDIYNDDVLGMNNKVDLFPFSLIARLGGFVKYAYFRKEN